MIKKNTIKINKKILSLLLLIVTIFGTIQPIFAVTIQTSGTDKWVSGQYDSNVFTTDNNTSVGLLIRRLINYSSGEKITVFCAEYKIDSPTGEIHTATHSVPTDSRIKKACKVAYFGWYSKYGDYVVDGGIMAEYNLQRKLDYCFTQQYVWEVLGQTSSQFRNADYQNQYVAFKNDIENKIATMEKRPSFDATTITVDAGTSKTITDSNNVLRDYNSINKSFDGITLVHNKGENTMTITVDANCTKESIKLSDSMLKSYGMIKEESKDNDTTIYFTFKEGVQNQLYSMNYNDPVSTAFNLKINIFGKLELAKKDNKGNFVPDTKFKISYNSDMSNPIGTYTTGANGKVLVEQLRPGNIYIQEVEVPKHLILDTTIKSATIRTAETTSYTATNNWKQGKLQVTKKDAETGKVVKKAGTIFDIYDVNNKKITSITTNENGVAISPLLDYNTYYVKEHTAPAKYTIKVEISDNVGVFENGKTYEVTIVNTRVKGTLTISKEDVKTGKKPQGEATLKGAIYGVYARTPILDPADDSMIYNTDVKVAEMVTNDEANATLNNLYLGQYYLKEISPSKRIYS